MKSISVNIATSDAIAKSLEALEIELDTRVEMVYISSYVSGHVERISSYWDVEVAAFVLPGEAWAELENGEFVHIKEA